MVETSEAITAQLQLQRLLASDSQKYYDVTARLADSTVDAFRDRRQMRSLETLAFRARSPVDVLTFIKSQTGKEGKKDQGWRYRDLGKTLLTDLERLGGEARQRVQKIYGAIEGDLGEERVMRVHLELIRLYIRHLVSHYLYAHKGE